MCLRSYHVLIFESWKNNFEFLPLFLTLYVHSSKYHSLKFLRNKIVKFKKKKIDINEKKFHSRWLKESRNFYSALKIKWRYDRLESSSVSHKLIIRKRLACLGLQNCFRAFKDLSIFRQVCAISVSQFLTF